MRTPHPTRRPLTLASLALAAVIALVGPAGEAVAQDLCGCAGNPESLGTFVSSDPASWPPGTVQTGSDVSLRLPEDGVLIFDGLTLDGLPDAAGPVSLRFERNLRNMPVAMLVAGDVSIAAGDAIVLDGEAGEDAGPGLRTAGGAGGPGGHRGGDGAHPVASGEFIGGQGLGPGGGDHQIFSCARVGEIGRYVASPDAWPLTGGSGGGGGSTESDVTGAQYGGSGGGGGGGALLLAANGTIDVDGEIRATGGASGGEAFGTGGIRGAPGSGGTLRLVASEIGGAGQVLARGGSWRTASNVQCYQTPSLGGIRLEAFVNTLPLAATVPSSGPYFARLDVPGPLGLAVRPDLRIVRVAGLDTPDPASGWQGPDGPVDVAVVESATVGISLSSENIPEGTDILVEAKPDLGSPRVSATTFLSDCDAAGRCSASVDLTLPRGRYVLEAEADFTLP